MDKKWNLQDIRPVEQRRRREPSENRPLEKRPPRKEISSENDGTMRIGIVDGNSKKKKNLVLAITIFVVICGLGFFISFLMGGAEITVFPRNREPNVNATFTAYKAPQVGELAYDIMTLEAEGERQVSANGQEEVKEQATGEIIIYNNSNSTERLKKNTRFETPDGLIFKITESVIVPGAKEDSGGNVIPGSIRADVFADGVGEQYNISKTRMSIPGYKEGGYMDLYNNVYAENPESFVGGFDGMKFIIDDEELETEKQRLQTELRNALLERVDSEKPAGFVVFDDAVTFTYQSLPAVEYGDNLATIKEKALLQIPIFDQEEFAKYIASATVPGFENEPVKIVDHNVLKFSYEFSTTSSSDISNLEQISFELSGRPLIVWTFDEGKLKTDIIGKEKTALPTILGGYPAIERAEAVVRPFWKRSFPNELEEIEIFEVIEQK